ncbi:hypothetical protein Mapa_016651 [Marchantia paleacea]|nr:hypothetical protein Mapa_016651 [Marchantia paleacea]
MRIFLLLCLLCLNSKSGSARYALRSQATATSRMLFVFGDSYADTGNSPTGGNGWKFPYGETWPGSGAGRYSNGFVKTDVLASEVLHIPSPPPYAQLTVNTTLAGGINFAVAGSGAGYAYGSPPFATQVGWLSTMVKAGYFQQEALKRAVVLVSVAGNDYGAYNGSTLEGYIPLVHEVALKIDLGVRELYSMGVRNFMVSSLSPLACTPARTFPSNYSACEKNATVDEVVSTHNYLLGNRLKNISTNLNDSSIVYLQQTAAMEHILTNPSMFNLTEGLRPCCDGFCGETSAGVPLFSVCENPDQHMFWDNIHPTQAAWKAIVNLYMNDTAFTQFSPSLKEWLDTLP